VELFQIFSAGYMEIFNKIEILIVFCMLMCNDKYYSAPRLGKLQELMYIEGPVPGMPGMALLSRMPLALSTRWAAGMRSELGSAILVGILCC